MLRPLLPAGFERIRIQGVVGVLEVCLKEPERITGDTPLFIIAHPHPLHGGSFYNKVVQTLAKAGDEAGAIVVCFNFRGVGESEGVFDHGQGERYDLQAVVQFAQQRWGSERPLWQAGFSFGAWMTALMANLLQPTKLILVAPPVSLYPMEQIFPHIADLTVIQGAQDEVVDAQEVASWALARQADILWRHDASHFFHKQLLWLRQATLLSLAN